MNDKEKTMRDEVSQGVIEMCEKAENLWGSGEKELAKEELLGLWLARAKTMMQSGDPFRVQDAVRFNQTAEKFELWEAVMKPSHPELIDMLNQIKEELIEGKFISAPLKFLDIAVQRSSAIRDKGYDPVDCFAEAIYDEVEKMLFKALA